MCARNKPTTNFDEFIESFKSDYIDICWHESEFVKNNGHFFYDAIDDFEDSIKNIEKEIDEIKSFDENYYLTQKNNCGAYVLNFENNLDEKEKVFITSLLPHFQTLLKWNPENKELIKLKVHIMNNIVNQIDGNLGSGIQTSYIHSKFYDIEEEKNLNKMRIESMQKEIQDLEQFIQFKQKFLAEEKELIENLKHSIQNI